MGEEIHVDFNTGSGGSGGSGGSPGGPVGARPRVSGGASGADFDYTELVPSFVQTAREIIFNPVGFFRGIRRQGDFLNPLIFAIICAVISGLLTGIIGLLISLASGNGIGSAFGSLFGAIIITPIVTAIGLFVWAAIYHLLVILIIRPSHAGYEGTFRVVAYASVLQLASWLGAIPILGILVLIAIGVYGVVLSVLGIREIHSTTTGRAVAVVLIPAIIFALLALLIGVAIVAILAAAFSQGQ
jgi:hypothetical protein